MTNPSPTEPFRFTDADGDYLHIGIPNSPTTGHPALSFHTMAEPVHVPVEEVEGLITALRRLVAAQAAAPAVVEPPADQTAADVRDQLLHAIDFNYVASLGYTSPEELLAAYDTSRTQPADRAALHRIAEAALAAVETALGDTLAADAREEALAGIAAVLPKPADRRERYATAIHDAMEPDLSLVDQEPAYQALIARAAEAAVALADAEQTTEPVCICGHPNERHFEDVCQTCGCGDYLEPQDAAEVIARWRQAALKVRAGERAAALREAADRFAAFDLHAEAAALRRMADETQPEPEAPDEDGSGEPAELRGLPREVRRLVHAVDRMRADWAEAPEHGPERRALWTAVHEACDAVWNRPAAGARQDGATQ